jgi:hypothetical protein
LEDVDDELEEIGTYLKSREDEEERPRNEKCIVNYTNLLSAWPLLHQYYISQLKLQRSPCLLKHCNFFCITVASRLSTHYFLEKIGFRFI